MATSQYTSESSGAVAIAVMATLSSISLIVVSMRVYARAIMLRNFGVDDACAILACLLTIADATIIAMNVRNGLGSHISTLSGEQISNFLRMFYLSTVVYNIALAVIKTIFLLQYYRVIPIRQYKKTYIASVVLVTCWNLSQIFLNIFMCVPIASFWDVTIKGTCILNKSSFYVGAAGNILTDILIMVLPIPVLRSLKLGRRQKWILMSVFCLGIFTCLISLVRIKFLNIGTDITWHNVDSASWSVSELCCGIICACVPTLRPLLSSHDRGSSYDHSSYARHQDSRNKTTARQTGTSRSYEMPDLPRTLHSSESKDQLRPLESTVVVPTDVKQSRSRPQPGHGPGTHHVVIQGKDERRHSLSSDSEDPFSMHQSVQRIFWTMYVLERSMARTMGRFHSIPDRDINIPLPANIYNELELMKPSSRPLLSQISTLCGSPHSRQLFTSSGYNRSTPRFHTVCRVDKEVSAIKPQKIACLRDASEEWKAGIPQTGLNNKPHP